MKRTVKAIAAGYLAAVLCVSSPAAALAFPLQRIAGNEYELEKGGLWEATGSFDEKASSGEGQKASQSTAKRIRKAQGEEDRIETAALENYDTYTIDTDGVLIEYRGNGGFLTIPDGVKVIGKRVFRENEKIYKVIIPEGVTKIESGAFALCKNLEAVEFPSSLTEMGAGAFYQCSSLEEIQITNNWDVELERVNDLDYLATPPFSQCQQLKRVYVDEGVDSIPDYLLMDTGIEEIDLSGIKTIGQCAFQNCPNLSKVTLGSGLEKMGGAAFSECTALESIHIPGNFEITYILETVATGPFAQCVNLREVTLAENVTKIPGQLFKDCPKLHKIDLTNIEEIQSLAFQNCTSLVGEITSEGKEELYLKKIKTIGIGAFGNCSALKTIIFGENLERLDEEVLRGCNGLEEAYFYCEKESGRRTNLGENIFRDIPALKVYGYSPSYIEQYAEAWNEGSSHENKVAFYPLGNATGFSVIKDGWALLNSENDKGKYKGCARSNKKIPLDSFKQVMGAEWGKKMYNKYKDFEGICHGFTETSKLFFEQPEAFGEVFGDSYKNKNVFDIKEPTANTIYKKKDGTPVQVIDMLEYFHVSQFSEECDEIWALREGGTAAADLNYFREETSNQIQEIIDALESNPSQLCNVHIYRAEKKKAPLTGKYWIDNGSGHSLLAYNIEDNPNPVAKSATESKYVTVYDSNHPETSPLAEKKEGMVLLNTLLFEKIDGKWRWYNPDLQWGTLLNKKEENHDYDIIAKVDSPFTMDDFKEWCGDGGKAKLNQKYLVDVGEGNYKLEGKNVSIQNIKESADAHKITLVSGSETASGELYYIPYDQYTITSLEGQGMNLSMDSYYFGVDIVSPGINSGMVVLNDQQIMDNSVVLYGGSDKEAKVGFGSAVPETVFEEIWVTGKGVKEQMHYTLKSDGKGLQVDGVTLEQVEAIIDGENVAVTVEHHEGSSYSIDLSEKNGQSVILVKDEHNRVIASSDGTEEEKPGTENPGEEDKPGTDKPGTENPGEEKPGTDKPGAENPGGNQGGSTGGNQGGSTGDNQGGSTGGNSGSGSGGGSGSSSGGSSGGGSGSSSGGGSGSGSGSRRSGGGSSSSASRGILITKPSYYGTGTWESNAASTAWKLKIADGTTLALQWGFIDGVWYLFGMDGYTYTGWQMVNNQWYYFQPNAMMKTGWIYDNNQWYYLNDTGAMQTSWVFYNNQWYYLNDTGAMQTGWVFYNNQWYYLSADGSMLAGTTTPDGYVVGADGVWIQ